MLINRRPKLTEEIISPTRARYSLEPLEPGFGYTLGNAIRRTMLSSIPGAGIVSVKMDGVDHEFTYLEGVAEDVIEIVLSLKQISISSDSEDPLIATIDHKGAGEITAADIKAPEGVQIHNPEAHICTCNAKAKIHMELTIDRGRGYVSAEQNRDMYKYDEIGHLAIDTIYSPVLKVAYKVEATRVEQRTDFDRLVIDIDTKPSISPREALASAGSTVVELFGLFKDLDENAEGLELVAEEIAPQFDDFVDERLEILDLSTGAINSLKRSGIKSIADLMSKTYDDIMHINGMGAKKVTEVVEKLNLQGKHLKPSDDFSLDAEV